ncbi:flagellar assembly protein FliW [Bacillus sp. PK3_68]|uniref:flagellar assembly protein FliW n=1 Tax=Bacillus sp. PK3_68 TaxID=2027408 RepID=UPI000E74E2D9|nr:flagellar assembly protein FliW [Bacillus sp. PK3_68]RJS60539.1 flagellar assembly protein FliW [Bacillus sp. PK3_68]
MDIQTKYHGNIIIENKDIWHFDSGIPGFDTEKRFTLLSLPDNEIFYILQSVQTPDLGFVVANPFAFFKDYDFTLEDSVAEQLDLETTENVQVLVILTVKETFQETTANLQAPIILNHANNRGKQVILNNTNYKTRHAIFPEKQEKKG